MSAFDDFSEMVERNCCLSWRSVIGRENDVAIGSVDSVVFTMSESESSWMFSFAIRHCGKWYQSKRDMPPVEYDIFAPNDDGQNRSPMNIASDLSYDLVEDAVRGIPNG